MKEFFRFISKNKLSVFVEVLGISLAFAFTIPLLSFWADKWSIDHGHGYKDIFAVCPIGSFETTIGLGPELSETIPEVEQYAQVYVGEEKVIRLGDNTLMASGMAVNTGFFDVFPVEFIAGTPTSLAERRHVLISGSFASKMDLGAIGQTFVCAGEEYLVSGIFNDIHRSLMPSVDIIFNIDSPLLNNQWKMPDEYWDDIYTFVKVRHGVKPKDLIEKCKKVSQTYYSSYYSQHPNNREQFKLIRYDRISSNIQNVHLTQTWGLSLWALELFGLILFVCAILNYINLNVALSFKRGKEWALKKLLGSTGWRLFAVSFLETLSVTLVCFVVGWSLSGFITPAFNNFFRATHTFIELENSITFGKGVIYFIFIILLSVVASMIPASISRRYVPVNVVKGEFRGSLKRSGSNILVGIQCFFTVALLVVSVLFFAQYKKMTGRSHGQLADHIFVISGDYTKEALVMAADALRALPFVKYVGRSNDCPGDGRWSRVTVKSPDGTGVPLYVIQCDRDAFAAFGFQTESGQSVSEGLWLSDSAMKELALQGIGPDNGMINGQIMAEVNGIISDFVMDFESDIPAGVEIMENSKFNRLIINTVDGKDDFREKIMKVFEGAIVQSGATYELPTDFGYLEDFYEKTMRPTKSIFSMLTLYALLALILGILGLVAISAYYISLHRKDTAIRKVFGSTNGEEIRRNLSGYLKVTLVAGTLGCMLGAIINMAILQSYSYRLSSTFWVYPLVMVFVLGVTSVAVYSQIGDVISKNPVIFLKDE